MHEFLVVGSKDNQVAHIFILCDIISGHGLSFRLNFRCMSSLNWNKVFYNLQHKKFIPNILPFFYLRSLSFQKKVLKPILTNSTASIIKSFRSLREKYANICVIMIINDAFLRSASFLLQFSLLSENFSSFSTPYPDIIFQKSFLINLHYLFDFYDTKLYHKFI